jgi:hypothetical protein
MPKLNNLSIAEPASQYNNSQQAGLLRPYLQKRRDRGAMSHGRKIEPLTKNESR